MKPETKVKCPVCGWKGTVWNCEPEEHPACPECLCSVIAVRVANIYTAGTDNSKGIGG